MNIYSFEVLGQVIDMTLREGMLAYTFQRQDKNGDLQSYGIKVKVPSEEPFDLIAAASQLIINAVETIQALDKEKNENIS